MQFRWLRCLHHAIHWLKSSTFIEIFSNGVREKTHQETSIFREANSAQYNYTNKLFIELFYLFFKVYWAVGACKSWIYFEFIQNYFFKDLMVSYISQKIWESLVKVVPPPPHSNGAPEPEDTYTQ